MRQTLFHIPHEILGYPVLGPGWLFVVWAVLSVALLVWLIRRHGWNAETRGYLPVLVIVAAAILFLLPRLEEVRNGAPVGFPIRGYGVFLLAGVVSAVALAAYRARRMGVDPEIIYSLAFWSFIVGIAGARTFYVVQYWDRFQEESPLKTVVAVFSVNEGGLVIYGSLIFGLAAIVYIIRLRGLPLLATADLIAPSLALGLALGRLGCLMNGCCFGGVRNDLPWALAFPGPSVSRPLGSPPYQHQHGLGLFFGIRIGGDGTGKPVVRKILQPRGGAAADLLAGDRITAVNGNRVGSVDQAKRVMSSIGSPDHSTELTIETDDGRTVRWTVPPLPRRSLPVHPTQIYSAIHAALLCLFLLAYYPYRRRDGEVIAIGLTVYAIARFLLEWIRDDEGGIFGTSLTPAQMVSLVILLAMVGLWVYILRQERGSALPLRVSENAS